jgi:uncharacterized LabA/DUF88 family protein
MIITLISDWKIMFNPKTFALEFAAKNHAARVSSLEGLLTDKTIVYIDFGNVREWRHRLGWEIDLRKLKDFLDSFGVQEVKFYFGTLKNDAGANKFMTFVHKCGYTIRTKTVKVMRLSIDLSNAPYPQSKAVLSNFIDTTLLRKLKDETIKCLDKDLRGMNEGGEFHLECWKCNFDVEIGTDMRIALQLNEANSFCLFSGDSDFADPISVILKAKRKVSVFGTARHIASELNALKQKGLEIEDVAALRDFLQK